ncbi:MAG: glycosyltransferase [Leptospirales bacterium]
MEIESVICLQNFLFSINTLSIDGLSFQTDPDHSIELEEDGLSGFFPDHTEGKILAFDGVVNAFPVGTFARHTSLSHVRLQGEMTGEISIQIRHVDETGNRILYEEPFEKRSGPWESPRIPIERQKEVEGQEGRYYLSCRIRGTFTVRDLGWWSISEHTCSPTFLVCVTTYQGNEFVRGMIGEICSYEPLKKLAMSLLVVDNGQTLRREQLPPDSRLSLLPQPNLGSTGGVMRGLHHARSTGADYLVTIADDGLILPPEILYRLMILQSLVKEPLSIGSMMLYLDRPTVVLEQGARVSEKTHDPMHSINTQADLLQPESFKHLYLEESCDYTGSWLMSDPVPVLHYLPAFFLYLDDVLQGLLLKQDGIRTIVPPHLFIWQTFGNDFKSFKGYTWFRNELAMRLGSGLSVQRLSTILWFFSRIRRSLTNYDYDRAQLLLISFEDVLRPSGWAQDPISGAERIQKIRKYDPTLLDFSSRLSTVYAPAKQRKRSRLISGAQRVFSFFTIAGYLNPFTKQVASDGGFVFRYQGDNDVWQWAGYRQVAVIDSDKRGYLCQRSWKRMTNILARTISASIRWFLSTGRLRKEYRKPSATYQKIWTETFETIDRAIKNR